MDSEIRQSRAHLLLSQSERREIINYPLLYAAAMPVYVRNDTLRRQRWRVVRFARISGPLLILSVAKLDARAEDADDNIPKTKSVMMATNWRKWPIAISHVEIHNN